MDIRDFIEELIDTMPSEVRTFFIVIAAIIGIVIAVKIIKFIVRLVNGGKKKTKTSSNADGTATPNVPLSPIDDDSIGKEDEVTVPCGYYRMCPDNQVVIKRNDEQQKIVEEYFVVKNYKTTTCKSVLKKAYNVIKPFMIILLMFGIIMGGVHLLKESFDFESALENTWCVIGLVSVGIGIVLSIVLHSLKTSFEASIKHSIAPKAVMTDEEYEQLVAAKLESLNVVQMGLERLGLDEEQIKEISPIILHDRVDTEESFIYYNDETDEIHSSTHYVTLLYFTDEQLFAYKYQFDMCCDRQKEWATELFYQDICDVSSYVNKNVVKSDNFKYSYSTVNFEIITSNSRFEIEIDGANENVTSLYAMKQKIRERKAKS